MYSLSKPTQKQYKINDLILLAYWICNALILRLQRHIIIISLLLWMFYLKNCNVIYLVIGYKHYVLFSLFKWTATLYEINFQINF